MSDDATEHGEDALKDAGDIKSGDEPGTPVHAPTVDSDKGRDDDGTGEGHAADANQTTPGAGGG